MVRLNHATACNSHQLTGKPEPLFGVFELISRRLDAELLRSRAEPTGDEETSADDNFF